MPFIRPTVLNALPFIDTFSSNSNPISLSPSYVQGFTTGGSWHDMKAVGGVAYATAFTDNFDDGICIFKSALINTSKHYAKITAHKQSGYTPADSHEIEALLMFDITSGNARGYEMDFVFSSSVSPVRWNGGLGSFDVFGTNWGTTISGSAPGALNDGDVVETRADSTSGSPVFTMLVNGSQVWQFTDTTASKWTTGYPGIGSFIRSGVGSGNEGKYAIDAWECGNL